MKALKELLEAGRRVISSGVRRRISPRACRGLHLENDRIVFSARFAGVAMQIYVPPSAVLAVYAKENGRGMVFSEEEETTDTPPTTTPPGTPNKPKLTIVK